MAKPPIALDGPAASGKSTVAKLVAQRLGALFVSTGELYRTVTLAALRRDIDPATDPEDLAAILPELDVGFARNDAGDIEVRLDGRPVPNGELRSSQVADKVGYVARIPEVRAWLAERQRETRDLGWVVAEGRDIGTVVFPDTPYKFFLSASPRERARRRLAQDGENPPGATLDKVARDIARRDELDSTRSVAPLRAAPDAEIIETDRLAAAQVAEHILRKLLDTPR